MTDEYPFYPPNYKPPPREARPAELLFEFVRAVDQAHVRCELLYRGGWCVEARFLRQGDLLMSRRFDTRALAVQWAEAERPDLEKASG